MSFAIVDCRGLSATQLADATVLVAPNTDPAMPRITPEDVEDSSRLAKMLERIRGSQAALFALLANGPVRDAILYLDLSVTISVAFTLRHGFGRRCSWLMTDATTANPLLYRSAMTDDDVTLVPGASAVVSVMVF